MKMQTISLNMFVVIFLQHLLKIFNMIRFFSHKRNKKNTNKFGNDFTKTERKSINSLCKIFFYSLLFAIYSLSSFIQFKVTNNIFYNFFYFSEKIRWIFSSSVPGSFFCFSCRSLVFGYLVFNYAHEFM